MTTRPERRTVCVMSSLQKALIAVFTILVLTVGYLFFHKNKATAPTESQAIPKAGDKTITLINPASLAGVYEGKLPCADCEGIDMVLTLNPDGSYESQMTYLGKSTQPFIQKGKWGSWENHDVKKTDGQIFKGKGISLDPETDTEQIYLLVNDNQLKQLDRDYNEINSPFNQTLIKKSPK